MATDAGQRLLLTIAFGLLCGQAKTFQHLRDAKVKSLQRRPKLLHQLNIFCLSGVSLVAPN